MSPLPRGPRWLLAPVAAALSFSFSACGAPGGGADVPTEDAVTLPDVPLSCPALRIEPAMVRVAVDRAVQLRAVGGSGGALFGLDGETRGATIELGGGLRAGSRAATFTAIARDARCNLEARAAVEVVGPFDVQPAMTRVAAGGTVRFRATGALGPVSYAILQGPRGAGTQGTIGASDGVFSAGTVAGSYDIVARDTGSGNEVRLAVDVGAGVPLRPRAAVVALPAGERVRLDWRGGSGSFTAQVSGPAGGRVVTEDGVMYFDATMARVGTADVAVTDAFTRETATVRVLVGDVVGVAPVARGTQTGLGDMATGDVNGDGRVDLIVGHAERSAVGLEAGGVLVYYGNAAGGFGDRPDVVIEGVATRDRFGSVVVVRDVNADRIDDVLVGAPEEDLGESDRGSVQLFLGDRAGLTTTAERVLVGEDINHRFGTSVLVEDLNGDGAPELIVGAPGAVSPAARACLGGRVYVYRNRPDQRGIFETVPWQVIDLRDSLSDEPEAPVPCSNTPLGAGRALALIDMDGDRALDLAVGAPTTSYPTASRSHGAVMVYRGGMGGAFETAPAWSIHLDPAVRTDNANFGLALDVVRDGAMGAPALVVRSSAFNARNAMGAALASAGGFWVFAPGSLGARATPGPNDAGMTVPRVRNVTTAAARAFFYGDAAARGVGRSATLADVDGDGRAEYVVGNAASGAPGSIAVFSLQSVLTGTGALAPASALTYVGNELQGFRVAGLRGAMGQGAGLASWAAWRATVDGPFIGAVDYVTAGAAPLATRWMTRLAIQLPGFGASDRAGQTVALSEVPLAGGLSAMYSLLGAPGAHSPAVMGRPAGDRLRTGAIDAVPTGSAMPVGRAWIDRTDAQTGNIPFVVLNFDGDGIPDVAVGDPNETSGGAAPAGFVNPDGCTPLNATGQPTAVGGRGLVRVYSLTSSGFVERFRLVSAREPVRPTAPVYLRNRFGASLGVADVNGDGLEDVVVGRNGATDATGAEVVLGRRYTDAMNRVVFACNTGTAPVFAPSEPTNPLIYGLAVAGVGDLDGDGCGEVAASVSRANIAGNPARAGLAVAFGYDAAGRNCRGRTAPFVLHVVPDDRNLGNNVAGATPEALASRGDDTVDLPGVPSSMGRVIALGRGDVTGDGVDDLVFRDADLAFGAARGPGVEIISGAFLAGLCPSRACPAGRTGALWSDGDYHVVGLRALDFPARRVIVAPSTLSQRFATAMALADLDGDRAADLAVGAADDPSLGTFAGLVRVYRGGAATTTQSALLGDPWMLAVGDLTERGEFGASVAAARGASTGAWLAVGAPASRRNGTGGEVGGVFRWRVDLR